MKVELIDVMGSDKRCVEAARVSIAGNNVKATSRDEKLIRYCMRNKHWSIFEHCFATFRVEVPVFVARQWHRHRTQSYNEMSGRYGEIPLEFYWPGCWRVQANNNKQGSSGVLSDFLQAQTQLKMEKVVAHASRIYKWALSNDTARELARIVLPQNTMTCYYASANLRNWMQFLDLRCDPHAQEEIRVCANVIRDILGEKFPVCMQACQDNYNIEKSLQQDREELWRQVDIA